MAEREFDNYLARSGATLEGSRYTAYLAVTPRRHGFPMYFAICENRSFRDKGIAETAAAKAMRDFIAAWTKVMNADRFDLRAKQPARREPAFA